MEHQAFMKLALEQAKLAALLGEVPVGAVIVRGGEVIARGHNLRESGKSATAHAEIVAIEAACKALGSHRLEGCAMYVTLEPCAMCAGAILHAGMERVVFGAYEEIYGAVGSRLNLFYDFVFPHKVKFCGGVMEEECANLLRDFFREIRRNS